MTCSPILKGLLHHQNSEEVHFMVDAKHDLSVYADRLVPQENAGTGKSTCGAGEEQGGDQGNTGWYWWQKLLCCSFPLPSFDPST